METINLVIQFNEMTKEEASIVRIPTYRGFVLLVMTIHTSADHSVNA